MFFSPNFCTSLKRRPPKNRTNAFSCVVALERNAFLLQNTATHTFTFACNVVHLIEPMGFALAATCCVWTTHRTSTDSWNCGLPARPLSQHKRFEKKSGSHSGSWLFVDMIPCFMSI